jgi:hypothetical protein
MHGIKAEIAVRRRAVSTVVRDYRRRDDIIGVPPLVECSVRRPSHRKGATSA